MIDCTQSTKESQKQLQQILVDQHQEHIVKCWEDYASDLRKIRAKYCKAINLKDNKLDRKIHGYQAKGYNVILTENESNEAYMCRLYKKWYFHELIHLKDTLRVSLEQQQLYWEEMKGQFDYERRMLTQLLSQDRAKLEQIPQDMEWTNKKLAVQHTMKRYRQVSDIPQHVLTRISHIFRGYSLSMDELTRWFSEQLIVNSIPPL